MDIGDKRGKRGGARRGAGRPKGTSKLYAFRADREMAGVIDQQENKTEFIKACISKQWESSQIPNFDKIGTTIPSNRIKPLSLPFFDMQIVAGFPIPLSTDEKAQDVELLQMLCPYPNSSYLIRVQGDSMIDAGVNDGDILIVDKSQRNPSSKEIAVCELNGEYTVKRVLESEGRRWLVPANPHYQRIEITDGDSFNVWGVVTYIIHKPKG